MALINKLKKLVHKNTPVWSGNFASWEDATAQCTNYSDQGILDKVRSALMQVKEGKAAFERDSVLFLEPDYNWPLVSSLMHAFARESNRLDIIDFGGSLGSTYFQHRKWFGSSKYSWNVVEQPHFVAAGKKDFEDDHLKFHLDVDGISADRPSFLILSSVLAYLPDPYTWLEKLLEKNYNYIFIDRSPLVDGPDRLTIQQVPPEIYKGSYPAWFFNETGFLRRIQERHTIFAAFDCAEKAEIPSKFKGHYLIRK